MDIDYTVGEVELTYKSTSKSRSKIYSSEDAYKYLLPTYTLLTKDILFSWMM